LRKEDYSTGVWEGLASHERKERWAYGETEKRGDDTAVTAKDSRGGGNGAFESSKGVSID
jgi:hypothetical protein